MGCEKRGTRGSATGIGTRMGRPMERMGGRHSYFGISAARVTHATSHPGTRAAGRNDASKWLGRAVSRLERNLDQVSILPRPYCSRCPYLLVWQHHHLLARLPVEHVTPKDMCRNIREHVFIESHSCSSSSSVCKRTPPPSSSSSSLTMIMFFFLFFFSSFFHFSLIVDLEIY